MATTNPPVVILGGADRKAVRLPEEGRGKHPLSGYKGAGVRIAGRPVVEVVAGRLAESEAFGPVFIAGPSRVYGPLGVRAEIVDTDGSFGQNILAALRHVRARHPGAMVLFTTCDILPDVATLRAAMADLAARAPVDLWYPVIRAPKDRALLGASAWKPRYGVRASRGEAPLEVLPGHLLALDPEALRVAFVDGLFERGYRTRNRSILYRLLAMSAGLVGGVFWHDFLHVAQGRLPTLTRDIVVSAFAGSLRLRTGRMLLPDLEDTVRRIFIKRRHRERYPERRVSLPVMDGLSLALDIDTEEEARALAEGQG